MVHNYPNKKNLCCCFFFFFLVGGGGGEGRGVCVCRGWWGGGVFIFSDILYPYSMKLADP